MYTALHRVFLRTQPLVVSPSRRVGEEGASFCRYQMILGSPRDPQFAAQCHDRHPAWCKLLMMQEQLRGSCRWVFYIDSDAFFRMRMHDTSVEDWIAGFGSKESRRAGGSGGSSLVPILLLCIQCVEMPSYYAGPRRHRTTQSK